MDTSDTYIKMCQKAQEIQIGWEWEVGDYFWDGKESYIATDTGGVCGIYEEDADYRPGAGATWLPRQDQLQEMYGYYSECQRELGIYHAGGRPYQEGAGTFEQFWLRVIMEEDHKKEWNGEDWVAIRRRRDCVASP